MSWNLLRRGQPTGPIALVTAMFGGIDDLKPLPEHPGIDAFYYTDAAGRSAASSHAAATWTRVIVPDYPRYDFSPRLRGRYFKHQIHRLDEVRAHRWLVWADSTLRFDDLGFIAEKAAVLSRLPARQRALVVPHPERNTISEEYQFIQSGIEAGNPYLIQRYSTEKIPEQMVYFRSRGWNPDAPLWCGTFWMIENSEVLRRAWDEWWDQNLRFGLMDQLSLPVVLAAHGIAPQLLPVNLWKNDYFTWCVHRREM